MRRTLRAFVAAFALAATGAAADEIEVGAASLSASEEGIVLSADFELDLTPRL